MDRDNTYNSAVQLEVGKRQGFVNVSIPGRILSVVAGVVLALLAGRKKEEKQSYWGKRKKQPSSGRWGLAFSGGYLLYRGISGNCPINSALELSPRQKKQGIKIAETVMINKPREEVYAFWRNLENLPRFMKHLAEVRQIDKNKSYWKVEAPANLGTLEWEAEITLELENLRLVWHSLPGASVENAGEVLFKDAPGGEGTEVKAVISYLPPADVS